VNEGGMPRKVEIGGRSRNFSRLSEVADRGGMVPDCDSGTAAPMLTPHACTHGPCDRGAISLSYWPGKHMLHDMHVLKIKATPRQLSSNSRAIPKQLPERNSKIKNGVPPILSKAVLVRDVRHYVAHMKAAEIDHDDDAGERPDGRQNLPKSVLSRLSGSPAAIGTAPPPIDAPKAVT
jgi:hypothetical protein